MTDWHAYGIKGTCPFYAQLYPCIALVTRGKLLDWWIYKFYKGSFRAPSGDYPADPNRYKRAGNPGMVVCKMYYPYEPRTAKQVGWWAGMYNAVKNWQGFNDATKKYYNDRSKPIGDYGYHRYISLYLHGYIPTMADKVIATKLVAADGTGDFTSIQDGIDALPAGGGMVFVKEGTYTLAAKLTIAKSNVVLAGQGPATIITLANGVNDNVLEIGDGVANITDVIVTGLNIDGNKANQNAGNGIKILAVCDRISILGNKIQNCYGYGIYRDTEATYTRIEGNDISGSGSIHINLVSGDYGLITNNYLHDLGLVGGSCIYCYDEDHFIISNNIMVEDGSANTSHGTQIFNSNNGLISGNNVRGTYRGIYLESGCNGIMISENQIYDTYTYGIYTGSDEVSIIGNYVEGSGSDSIYSNGLDTLISDNFIKNSGQHGIFCRKDRADIINNRISGSQQHGIYFYGVDNSLISGNKLYNNGQGTNDTYSDIFFDHNFSVGSTYNHISDNYIVAQGANKTKYGYREDDVLCSYNSIWNNRVIGSVTAPISIQGANSNASDNLIT
jgi:parallel beta-helix repeat protein